MCDYDPTLIVDEYFRLHDEEPEYSCSLKLKCMVCGETKTEIFHDPQLAEAYAADPLLRELHTCDHCRELIDQETDRLIDEEIERQPL